MAPVYFLVSIYPEYDFFYCKCVPGGSGCLKCRLMTLCSDLDKVLRCSWGIKHEL
jgi:hypothetical protein